MDLFCKNKLYNSEECKTVTKTLFYNDNRPLYVSDSLYNATCATTASQSIFSE